MSEIVSTQIRIPVQLHRKLVKLTETSRRSLNEEIVWRLQKSLNYDVEDLSRDITELKSRMEGMAAEMAKLLERKR